VVKHVPARASEQGQVGATTAANHPPKLAAGSAVDHGVDEHDANHDRHEAAERLPRDERAERS
jgi:hypothetical protein